ncbi:MAG: aldehyde dehydrogenase family protein [Spirochaetales bacterium]|jgi:4-(gamma-glutamylamino)butanal dehydrogenase|nr:aldehyde dehydrogenase family protein [Spirochaetales bacterium]
MPETLSIEDYRSIAANLILPTQAFINGEFSPALSGETYETINPATGQILASIAKCGIDDLDRSVQKARISFENGVWSRISPGERKAILIHLVELIKKNLQELAVLGDITTPFGGYKHSGFGGRDNGMHAFDQYTEVKTIWIDLGDIGDS